jgi:BirA family biotin operon repressor/biotin-[acetyl-CoA-carboxylase] ligase
MPEELDLADIDAALAGTPFRGQIHHFPTIGSTNTHALEQARLGAPHGTCFVADEQSAGRGRSDHQWHSEAGQGLYLSVLIRPSIAPAELVWLPLLTGLAAHQAIQQVTGLSADLRWPNDILIGSRKVAGILVEAHTEANQVTAAVIGIGINVHQQRFAPDLATAATSLDLETGRGQQGDQTRQQLLIALLQDLNGQLAAFSDPAELAAIPDRIAAVSTWLQDRRVDVHGPQRCTGVTAGLDERGFLRIRTTTGLVTITTGGIRAAVD